MSAEQPNPNPEPGGPCCDGESELARCRERAREQIRIGERVHRRLRGYASRSGCVDAAHYLVADGGAARQGDDPRWLLDYAGEPGLASLVPKALEIERRAVKSWSANEALRVTRRLLSLPGTREAGERLIRIRNEA